MTKVINKLPNTYSPKCDAERTCYCQTDEHCAVGFKCVPGLAFPEYKLCKPAYMKPKLG